MSIKDPFIYKKLRAFIDSGNNSKLSYNFVCLGSYTITAYSQIDFLPATFTPLIIVRTNRQIITHTMMPQMWGE